MRTRPFSGEAPSAAAAVWLALDYYEIRPYARIRSSLLATRLAEVGRAWKRREASQHSRETAQRRVRKWADVTTLRGLSWLVRQGRAKKIGGGYLRSRPEEGTDLTGLLDACVEVEQRLRTVRVIWSNNPDFPGKEQPEETRKLWDGDVRRLLEQLEAVSRGIRAREHGAQTTRPGHGTRVNRPSVLADRRVAPVGPGRAKQGRATE